MGFPASTQKAKYYISCQKDGTFSYKCADGNKPPTIVHDVDGMLLSIRKRETDYAGQKIVKWVFDLTDKDGDYQLQLGYGANYAAMVINALCGIQGDISHCHFRVSLRTGKDKKTKFTNVVVFHNHDDKPLAWKYELFPKKDTTYNLDGIATEKDSSDWNKFWDAQVEHLNARLQAQHRPSKTEQELFHNDEEPDFDAKSIF